MTNDPCRSNPSGHCGHWHSAGRAEFPPVCCWCNDQNSNDRSGEPVASGWATYPALPDGGAK